jgi:hypothetical protein
VYYHNDDRIECDRCGEMFPAEDCDGNIVCHYSELTEQDYCCEDCLQEAEHEFRRENLMYSEYDDEEFDEEGHVTTWRRWHTSGRDGYYINETITFKSLQEMIDRDEVVLCNDVWHELPYRKEWAYVPAGLWGVTAMRIKVYND